MTVSSHLSDQFELQTNLHDAYIGAVALPGAKSRAETIAEIFKFKVGRVTRVQGKRYRSIGALTPCHMDDMWSMSTVVSFKSSC